MGCFNNGEIRLFLDDGLPSYQSEKINTHLITCLKCQQKVRELGENLLFTTDNINKLKEIWQEKQYHKRNSN